MSARHRHAKKRLRALEGQRAHQALVVVSYATVIADLKEQLDAVPSMIFERQQHAADTVSYLDERIAEVYAALVVDGG